MQAVSSQRSRRWDNGHGVCAAGQSPWGVRMYDLLPPEKRTSGYACCRWSEVCFSDGSRSYCHRCVVDWGVCSRSCCHVLVVVCSGGVQ